MIYHYIHKFNAEQILSLSYLHDVVCITFGFQTITIENITNFYWQTKLSAVFYIINNSIYDQILTSKAYKIKLWKLNFDNFIQQPDYFTACVKFSGLSYKKKTRILCMYQ